MTADESKRGPLRGPYAAIFLLLLTFAAFFPVLWAGWIWDDGDYVLQNVNLRTAAGLGHIWSDAYSNWQFYPLVFTTFWAEYHVWGLTPRWFHFDNVVIHAANAILLWRLLIRLELPDAVALLAAGIFAVHPVQVESVAWVSERKNVLCGFFYLSAALVYWRVKDHVLCGPKARSYLLAWVLFLCSLFAKTVSSTWPAAVLVVTWWKNGRIRQRNVWPLVPFFLVGMVMSSVTRHLEYYQVGAVGRAFEFSFGDRCIIAGRAVWFYLGKAIWPVHLAFIYPRWNLQDGRIGQAIIAAAAVITLIALLLLRRRIGRAPAAVALLFVGTLSPALGFINFYPMRYSFVADHFQYLAIIALIVAVAFVARKIAGAWGFVILLPLAVLTCERSLVYHDPVTFWTDAVNKNYGSWMTHVNLGQEFLTAGDGKRAEQEFRAATIVGSDEPGAWYRLARFEFEHNERAQAQESMRRLLEIDPDYLEHGD